MRFERRGATGSRDKRRETMWGEPEAQGEGKGAKGRRCGGAGPEKPSAPF